ncbi:hypothetical protein [Paraferrimonas sp. SM1919]|uniref:hypothetical protein n=1 Tax=Paraferrimonas sp. SM1919 TaxID=2662263 RepID=UPI0013D2575D|nr:hypothetical protein [Paraferrimonas sp. SM1919]
MKKCYLVSALALFLSACGGDQAGEDYKPLEANNAPTIDSHSPSSGELSNGINENTSQIFAVTYSDKDATVAGYSADGIDCSSTPNNCPAITDTKIRRVFWTDQNGFIIAGDGQRIDPEYNAEFDAINVHYDQNGNPLDTRGNIYIANSGSTIKTSDPEIFTASINFTARLVEQDTPTTIFATVVDDRGDIAVHNFDFVIKQVDGSVSLEASTIEVGNGHTFEAIVVGNSFDSNNLTYQWYKNGTLIEAESASSLILATQDTPSVDEYKVVVSDDLGETGSATTTLTVLGENFAPEVENLDIVSQDLTAGFGQTATLQDTLTISPVTTDLNAPEIPLLVHSWNLIEGNADLINLSNSSDNAELQISFNDIVSSQKFILEYQVMDPRGAKTSFQTSVYAFTNNLAVFVPEVYTGANALMDSTVVVKPEVVVQDGSAVSYSWSNCDTLDYGSADSVSLGVTLANLEQELSYCVDVTAGTETESRSITVKPQNAAVGDIASTYAASAFGALHEDGSVTVYRKDGPSAIRISPYKDGKKAIALAATQFEPVILFEDGTVKSFGDFEADSAALTNVQKIETFKTIPGYVAYHKDGSATVVFNSGTTAIPTKAQATVAQVSLNTANYAALYTDGTVVTDLVAPVAPVAMENVIKLYANHNAYGGVKDSFAAITSEGNLYQWGDASVLDIPADRKVIHVDIDMTNGALALLDDGSIVTAGNKAQPRSAGGHIVIRGGQEAGAAIKADGTMTSWGSKGANIATIQPVGTKALSIYRSAYNQSRGISVQLDNGMLLRDGQSNRPPENAESKGFAEDGMEVFWSPIYNGGAWISAKGEIVGNRNKAGSWGSLWLDSVTAANASGQQFIYLETPKDLNLDYAHALTRDGQVFLIGHIIEANIGYANSWADAINYVQGDMALLDAVDTTGTGMTNGQKRALCPKLDLAASETYPITGGMPCLLTARVDSDADGISDALEIELGLQPLNEYSKMHHTGAEDFELPSSPQTPDAITKLDSQGKPVFWFKPQMPVMATPE